MAKPEFYAAGYMIIENNIGETLFMRRKNTGFRDGEFQVPAGHLEGNETMIECIIREAKEELDINISEKDCEVVHISHRISKQQNTDLRVYFDFYVKINNFSGKLKNNEPEKCNELKFFNIKNIEKEEIKLFSYDLDILRKIKIGIKISEINLA